MVAEDARDEGRERIPFDLPRRGARDAVLVIAHPPLRDRLVEFAQRSGFTVLVGATGLDTLRLLEQEGHHLAYAVLAADEEWVLGLRKLLAEAYGDIKTVMLIA